MKTALTSTYQRLAGFHRMKSKASGRALAHPHTGLQLAGHLHLREGRAAKTGMLGTNGEALYLLYVSWLNGRAFLDLRQVDDGAWVLSTMAESEGKAFVAMEKEMVVLGL